ncbi:MAG: MlaD family protein [Acidimicrobiales bacterium]
MPSLEPRRQHILTGAIAIVLALAAVTIGVKGAFGAFRGGYELVGTFDAAGQGLLSGSDVKVRGVNIGQVKSIELVDGSAEITLQIHDDEAVPEGATATIRPKTLFGEKFVDIDPDTAEPGAPALEDGDEITHTQGGFELERVLSDTYPLLKAIDPQELYTVIDQLAEGADGLGDEVNRTLVNGSELSKVFADNADNTAQLLHDLALLSEELSGQATTVLEIADAANVALPTLNDNEDDVVALLQQTSRLSSDVADLLEANKPFVDASMVQGSRTLQLLYDQRTQVIPLVIGLREYIQTLTSVVRIPVGDGTLMAAVKGLLGTQACAVVQCVGADASAGAAAPPAAAPGEVPSLEEALPELPGTGAGEGSGSGLSTFLQKVLVG